MNTSSKSILFAAAALTAVASAQQKGPELNQQLLDLRQRANQAADNGNVALAQQLKGQYAALQARLGGDEPVSPSNVAAPAIQAGQAIVPAPTTVCGNTGVVGTTLSFNGTTGPIPDVSTNVFTATASGLGTFLYDVDMTTAITHTYGADLDISLTSPGGTTVDVSSDNGAGNDNVFNGTLWDDQSANSVTTYAYTNGVAAPDLRPEQSFDTFQNENPNGIWTLTIVDDAGIDVGNLASWSLSLTDWTPNPPVLSSPTTFTRSPNLFIPDYSGGIPGVASDSVVASGLGTVCQEVRLYTEITHTYNTDLLIELAAPNATVGVLSNRRGLQYDDVFNGTTWDQASVNGVASYTFTANGVVTPLRPEANYRTVFDNLDPNGTWTLTITDLAGIDTGTLVRWDLTIITCAGNVPPVPYCTGGTTTNGCVASINATNNPSLTQAQSCIVNVTNVEGQKSALMFYGIMGAQVVPWGAGNTSLLCVKPPTQRSQGLNTGGTVNTCNGTLAWNWDAFQAANPGAVGNPWTLGEKAWVQAWFRDPTAVKTTNLSNAVELTYQP